MIKKFQQLLSKCLMYIKIILKKYLDAACKRELLDKSIIDKYDLDILSDAIDSEEIFNSRI